MATVEILCALISYILNLVDLAEIALHRCVHRNYKTSEKIGKEITEIHYSFEFLDDFITPKPSLVKFLSKKLNVSSTKDTVQSEVPMNAIPTVKYPYKEITAKEESALECEDEESWMLKNFKQENHPLELMVCVTIDFHAVVACIT